MVTDHFNFKKQKHVLVLKDLMLDMLSQHQNWYIQKDLCLGHSKFSTTTEAMIAVCFLSLLFKEILHDDVVFVWGWYLLIFLL